MWNFLKNSFNPILMIMFSVGFSEDVDETLANSHLSANLIEGARVNFKFWTPRLKSMMDDIKLYLQFHSN